MSKEDAVTTIGGEEIERINSFEYLGSKMEANGENCSRNKKTGMTTGIQTKLTSIWKAQYTNTN